MPHLKTSPSLSHNITPHKPHLRDPPIPRPVKNRLRRYALPLPSWSLDTVRPLRRHIPRAAAVDDFPQGRVGRCFGGGGEETTSATNIPIDVRDGRGMV